MADNNVVIGLTGWNNKSNTGRRQERDDLPNLPFMKLQNGPNLMRIVTDPAIYYRVRYKSPTSKEPFGKKVRSSWPTYKTETGASACPLIQMGYKEPLPHAYFVIVIDREDQELKILDMSTLVYEQLQGIISTEKKLIGKDYLPQDFDIVINFNKKSTTPAGYYQTTRRDIAPLSQDDVDMIETVGREVLNRILVAKSAAWRPESVLKALKDAGWKEGEKAPVKAKSAKAASGPALEEPSDDDYSYKDPEES